MSTAEAKSLMQARQQLADAWAENERLRAENGQATTDRALCEQMLDDWNTRILGLEAEKERLREALEHAIEFAVEGWGYAPDYFKAKWDYEGELARHRAALAAVPEERG